MCSKQKQDVLLEEKWAVDVSYVVRVCMIKMYFIFNVIVLIEGLNTLAVQILSLSKCS